MSEGRPSDFAPAFARAFAWQARWAVASLFFECGCDECGVVATEPEGVIQDNTHFLFASDVWSVIEVASLSRIFQIDRWRNHRIADGERACRHFYSTSPT